MEAAMSPSSLRSCCISPSYPLTRSRVPPSQLRFYPKPALFSSLSFSHPAAAPIRCVGGGDAGGPIGGGGGGGGGDGSEGGDLKVAEVVRGPNEDVEEGTLSEEDVIFLHVGGMTCGGCANKVKRILESQPQVSSANVILDTETAIVWPVADAKVLPNWREELGETLAQHLTSCGFQSKLRGQDENVEQVPQ